jgi:hypothetical protein
MHVIAIIGECNVSKLVCASCLLLLSLLTLACPLFLVRRPPSVFEVIAKLWNSSSFNPVAPPSECRMDFQMATDCSYEVVAGLVPATPQEIEDCFTSMRSDLLRIITRWEQSGQGEGGFDKEEEEDAAPDHDDDNPQANVNDDESMMLRTSASTISSADNDSPHTNIGSLHARPRRALQSRAAFLNGRPSYLLYFWEVADSHQLLQSSLQRLTSNTGAADASMAPTVTSSGGSRDSRSRHGRHRGEDEEEEREVLMPLLQSLKELTEGQRQMRIDLEQDRIHEQELVDQRIESRQQEESRKRVFEPRTKVLDEAQKYQRLNAELVMGDNRSHQLSEFYVSELRLLEEELRQLEDQQFKDIDSNI